ncbi:TonB-dependent receptor [Novosphingobium album (ex Hu et al. 2023)]|uniref:TonB-dependent receptor n=1 Tax=Novosphingobium album (ex Hu et al. 2023) TaxID=2930093 RepID=A0ABT0B6U7_9SPHN|nr:TonB-dependent receptor [Novosphingobium album (ex Hu et al. 2023)]MCJ2180728.1 TonB-dependent receptor [Novosphingobium album (ex Hu et al. 2023)]
MNATKFVLLAGIAIGTLSTPALAQDSAADDVASTSGDIIVTASRRAERLQEVPIAVSAVTGDQLAKSGFQKLNDIQYQFSGVQFGSSPNDSGFRLRGVGSAGGFSSSSEQNVGTVVDNVVIPFGNPVNSLGDLERVEVLKGPQGTQFGKNASSGVINITTRRPDPTMLSGKGFVSYGSLNEWNANGSINLPVSENSALAVFGFYRKIDGFLKNVYRGEKWGGEESYGARAKFLLEGSDDFSIYLIGDYSKIDRKGPGQLWTLNRLPDSIAYNPLMQARFANLSALGVTPGFANDKSVEDYEGYTSEQNYGASVEINLGLGDYNLTSVTAWRRLDEGPQRFAIDATSMPVFTAQPTGVDQTFLSQELRISSPAGSALEFTGGVYASRRKVGDGNDFNRAQLRPAYPFATIDLGGLMATPVIAISGGQGNTQTRSDSLAAFFDGKYHLNDRLAVIGGLRYQYDWVKAQYFSIIDPNYAPATVEFAYAVPGFVVPYTAADELKGSTKKGSWSGRFGGEFKITPDVMLFGTIARGYLGPTVTFSGLTGTRTNVKPQTVRDITVGIKSQLFDRAVTFNANVFFDKYKNLQTSVFNGVEFLTENAGGFDAKGFEIDASWRVSPEFSLNGGFTYSDTKFTNYVTACPGVVKSGYTCYLADDGVTSLVQAKGEPLSGAPKYSATFGADLRLPVTDTLQFDWSANFYYRSRVQYAVADAYAYQKGYGTIGLNAGIGHPDGNWRVGVFARNLLDQRFHAAVISLPFADAGGYVNWMTREGRRTIGVSAQMQF